MFCSFLLILIDWILALAEAVLYNPLGCIAQCNGSHKLGAANVCPEKRQHFVHRDGVRGVRDEF